MSKYTHVLIVCTLAFAGGAACLAQTGAALHPEALARMAPAAAGLAVMAEAEQRADGYGDLTVNLSMRLRNRQGDETLRELHISQIEVPQDGDKMLVVFETPRAIRGTGLLSYSHPRAEDDQWLYLPALKRVKKITSRNRSGPFLSSEFAFEDLTAQELEKFAYRYLRTMPCTLSLVDAERQRARTVECHVVERVPLDRYSGYSRQEVWVDTEAFRLLRIDYFDRRGDLLKTLDSTAFARYLDHHWRAHAMQMTNAQNSKSTLLTWRDFQFANGLTEERHFSTNALQRVR